MIRILVSVFIFICFSISVWGQNEDCVDRILLCTSGSFGFNPIGIGIDDFDAFNNNSGCLNLGENATGWYEFTIRDDAPPGIALGFNISPDAGAAEDYDFAIYGPNLSCDSLGSPVRCSYADQNCFFCPETGLGMGETDTSEDFSGNGFLQELFVNPGETYIMVLDNFNTSGAGFNLTWTGPAAPFLDCLKPCEVSLSLEEDLNFCEIPDVLSLVPNVSGILGIETYQWASLSGNEEFIISPTQSNTEIRISPDYRGVLVFESCITDDLGDGNICRSCDTINININGPIVEDLPDINFLCEGDEIGITPVITTNADSLTFIWTTPSGTQDQQEVLVSSAGLYTLEVVDNLGCSTTESFNVLIDPINAEISVFNPTCFNLNSGSIAINNITGGAPPYSIFLDGTNLGSDSVISDLTSTTYEVEVFDANNCPWSQSIIIMESEEFVSSFDTTILINSGDAIIFHPNINPAFDSISAQINWESSDPSLLIDCVDCITLRAFPCTETDFFFSLESTEGCSTEGVVRVLININPTVYIPNTFRPNSNVPDNQLLRVFTSKDVTMVTDFQVFNRWGDRIYTIQSPYNPNQEFIGWNGDHNGQPVEIGIYVYWLQVEISDGTRRIIKGDVTLLR